jgi:hypothetical protein
MLFLKYYILFCLLVCLVFEVKLNKVIKQHTINIHMESDHRTIMKKKILNNIFEHIKIWFLCFVPILNLLMLISLLINGINVKDEN